MKVLIVSLLLCAGLASAQTEVRRAVVLPSYKDLKYPPLPPLKIPDPVEFTLSNGMKILLLEDHELPLVSGAALIRTGNLFDPVQQARLGWPDWRSSAFGWNQNENGRSTRSGSGERRGIYREPDRRIQWDA